MVESTRFKTAVQEWLVDSTRLKLQFKKENLHEQKNMRKNSAYLVQDVYTCMLVNLDTERLLINHFSKTQAFQIYSLEDRVTKQMIYHTGSHYF